MLSVQHLDDYFIFLRQFLNKTGESKMKKVLLSLIALTSLVFTIQAHAKHYPGYGSYPDYGSYPSNGSYPSYGSYPSNGSYPSYGSYPNYGSYPVSTLNPTYKGYLFLGNNSEEINMNETQRTKILVSRANMICRVYFRANKASFVDSQNVESLPVDLIEIVKGTMVLKTFDANVTAAPTYINHLECD